jgi:hypothetical protein
MDKRTLHHIWTRLRPVTYWYFLTLFIISSLIAVLALRQNNIRAIELRDKVLKVDEANGDVEAALRELRSHVYSHMNANLASGEGSIRQPVQLKYRYERLVRAEKQRVSQINEKVYTDAQIYCERLIPTGTIAGRVPCVQEYVGKNTVPEQVIPDSLYKFDFAAPSWSPDLAGWSLVLSGVFGLLTIFRFLLEKYLKHTLHRHL